MALHTFNVKWACLRSCARMQYQLLLLECIVPTVKFCECGFCGLVFGPLHVVSGKINVNAYMSILNNQVVPTLWRFYGIHIV